MYSPGSGADDADDDEEEFSSAEEDALTGPRDAGGRSDDFDDFDDSYVGGSQPSGGAQKSQVVNNQRHDEAYELSDEDEDPKAPSSSGPSQSQQMKQGADDPVVNQAYDEAVELSSEGSVADVDSPPKEPPSSGPGGGTIGQHVQRNFSQAPAPAPMAPLDRSAMRGMGAGSGEEEDGEAYADGSAPGEGGAVAEGLYDPEEFVNLAVSTEIKELFQYITRYKPHNIELETKMKPFIPDYIPAVGDIDSFVKVPRPDGKADNLGLTVMDEPSSIQSDPTVLTLQLRAVTKSSNAQPMLVRAVESAEKNPKAISGWISSISELHRHKPPPSVRYTKQMPDIEALMQILPAQLEELLEATQLPDGELNMDLQSYVRVVCALLDIPVHGSLTESLHVLFTLFSDFKANVHFQQQLSNEAMGQDLGGDGQSQSFGMSQ